MMKLLLILLSAVMTFTVETKSSVKATGTWPGSMSASYACSYQKGDVRAGDTATLNVSGLDGTTIEKIEVYLKSNKTAGAGKITMKADGSQIYQKEGTYKDWYGDYNNTDYHPIGWSGKRSVDALEVQIIGTTNSLHIEKYEISWRQGQTYSVALMNGNEIYDVLEGNKVTLPTGLAPMDAWDFVGWSETEFWQTEQMPVIHTGSYQPTSDVTLWAVYRKDVTPTLPNVVDLEDGAYVYMNTTASMAMSGGVVNGMASAEAFNPYEEQQMYEITFDPDGRATIQLIYVYGEAYIGFEGTQLADTPSKWEVYHENDKTAFYTTVGTNTYLLLPGMVRLIGDAYYYVTEMVAVDNIELATTALRTAEMPEPLYLYTCHPEAEGMEKVMDEGLRVTGEWIVPFGNYELIIKDGKKSLKIRE